MDDDELDFLEAAMGSWVEPVAGPSLKQTNSSSVEAQHDITAYVAAKVQHLPRGVATRLPPLLLRGTTNAVATSGPAAAGPAYKSNRVYGYQEPKPLGRGRYKQEAAAALAAAAADRFNPGGWDFTPSAGIPVYDPNADRNLKRKAIAAAAIAASSPGGPGAGGSPKRKAHTAGHPFRNGGPVKGNAFAQPIARRSIGNGGRLPPIKPSSQPVTRGRRRGDATDESGFLSDAGERRGTGTMPAASTPRRAVASAPQPDTASPEFFFAKLKATLRDNEHLMQLLAEERAAKNKLQQRLTRATTMHAEATASAEEAKGLMGELTRSAQAGSRKDAERTKLAHRLAQKDAQLRDLRRMILATQQRVASLESEARPLKSAASTGALLGGNTDIKAAIRNLAKQNADAKRRHDNLSNRKRDLQTELNAVLAQHRTKLAAQAQAAKDADRERSAAIRELEKRLTHEMQSQISRTRENEQRALRHREREHDERMAQLRAEMDDIKARLAEASRSSKEQTNTTSEAHAHVTEQHKALESATTRETNARRDLDAALSRKAELQTLVAAERETIAGLERERERAEEEPKRALAPAKEKQEAERKQLLAETAARQKRQADLLQVVAKLEADLAMVEVKYPADGAATLRAEIAGLEAEFKKLDAHIDDHNVALAAAKKDLADAKRELSADEAKDRQIEECTRAMAAAERELKAAEQHNTRLLEKLDLAERMVAMNGLR